LIAPALAAQTGEEMAAQSGSVSVGRLAPAATLDTLDGKRIDLSDAYGTKPVYLKFWATWCVPCRQQMPHFQAAFRKYERQIQIVAVNLGLNDEPADVRSFLEQTQLAMPVAIDVGAELATAFDVIVTPLHVLIDADGRVVYVGHAADERLDRALEQLSHSKPTGKPAQTERRRLRASPVPRSEGDSIGSFPIAISGRMRSFGPDAKRTTVIAFITEWCESYLQESRPQVAQDCRKTREALSRASREVGDGVQWLTVASRVWTNETGLDAYRNTHRIDTPLVLDSSGEIFQRFGIIEVPTVIVVDTDGRILERFDGYDSKLMHALARLPRSVPTTR
jgi:peroxiredoxin